MPRDPGWSGRVKLTLSYAVFLTAAGAVLCVGDRTLSGRDRRC